MDISRRKPILKNRVPEHIEKAVVDLAIENLALGQKRASWELELARSVTTHLCHDICSGRLVTSFRQAVGLQFPADHYL